MELPASPQNDPHLMHIYFIFGKFHFFLDTIPKILQSKITKETSKALWLVTYETTPVSKQGSSRNGPMHDFLISLVRAALVTSPAIAAVLPAYAMRKAP
jgi:hypothetical protein